jgi:hypothetical protein
MNTKGKQRLEDSEYVSLTGTVLTKSGESWAGLFSHLVWRKTAQATTA